VFPAVPLKDNQKWVERHVAAVPVRPRLKVPGDEAIPNGAFGVGGVEAESERQAQFHVVRMTLGALAGVAARPCQKIIE
jgi:hypothetical protein